MADEMLLNAGERLDRLPFGRYHRRILALIGAGMFLEAFDLYLQGGVLGALLKTGWSSLSLNASFISATFFGMVIGAWCSGILGDRFGRRFCYQFNLLIFGLASLAAVFAPNMATLIVLRFVMGIGFGAEVVVSYGTLTEFVPAVVRGRAVAVLALITNVTLFVASWLGTWIIPHLGWRYMFLLVGVGSLVVWYLRKRMPESPRWLEARGRYEEADGILREMEAEHGLVAGTARPLPAAQVPAVPLSVVFSRGIIGRTALGALINITTGFSLYGLIAWLPSFFVKEGISITSSLEWTTVMSLGAPAGAAIGFLIADRWNRRPTIVGASLCAAALAAVYPMITVPYVLLGVGFLLVTSLYILLTIAFALYVPELFDTRYRLRGAGVCSTAGRLTTAFVQFAVVALFSWGGVGAVVGLLVCLLLIQGACVAAFGVETGRRALEKIAASDQPGANTSTRPGPLMADYPKV